MKDEGLSSYSDGEIREVAEVFGPLLVDAVVLIRYLWRNGEGEPIGPSRLRVLKNTTTEYIQTALIETRTRINSQG